MPTLSLEERVAVLEVEVIQVKEQLQGEKHTVIPWWEEIFGSFANSTEYQEAMRLGREYRESLRPQELEVT